MFVCILMPLKIEEKNNYPYIRTITSLQHMLFFRSNNLTTLNDEELIAKFTKEENSIYIGELFSRYAHMAFGVCIKYLKNEEMSRDAVMHVYESLLEDLKKHEVKNFKGWFHIVVKNHCLMELRKQKTDGKKHEAFEKDEQLFMELEQSVHQITETVVDEDLEFDKLGNCLEQLKEEQRKCVELFFLQEKCYKEIAGTTNYEIKKVKSYIQNGKRNLKNCLENVN